MNKDKVLDFFSVVRAVSAACVIVGLLVMTLSLTLMATSHWGFGLGPMITMLGSAALGICLVGGMVVAIVSVARHLVARTEFRSEPHHEALHQP